jgi:tRNA-uridine 2-sulfurtransferase
MGGHSNQMSALPPTRVLVALSGGVDSSVAALLLQQQGHDLVGVFLRNGVERSGPKTSTEQGCCSVEDARDAALVADQLGIPFHVLDMKDEFHRVQSYFRHEYEIGRTPNPCAVCNRDIKFGALADFADAVGASHLATGHYAQLHQHADGLQLLRGADLHKDQSYVLFPVSEQVLRRTLLPIGNLQKPQTRALAEQAGLPVFAKPDSQEICFVPDNDYRQVLRQNGGLGKAGRMLDLEGKVLAHHDGHMAFTRGQRRGLGFASTQPMYVIDIQADSGDILVGPRAATVCQRARVTDFQTFGLQIAVDEEWHGVEIQFRSSPGGQLGQVRCLKANVIEVEFAKPAESVMPGQGLTVYRGNRLLGGGWIDWAESAARLEV